MLLLLLAACPWKNGAEDLGPTCVDTVTDVALAEVTPLGFAAAEPLAFLEGAHVAEFTYAEGGTTDLTIEVARDGDAARYVDSEADYPDTGTYEAIGIECPDRVEIDGTVAFTTADGAFAELWGFALSATEATAMGWSGDIPDAVFAGSYRMEDHVDATDWESMSASTRGAFDAAGGSGGLDGMVMGEEECDGDECTAWASQVGIGTWTTGDPPT